MKTMIIVSDLNLNLQLQGKSKSMIVIFLYIQTSSGVYIKMVQKLSLSVDHQGICTKVNVQLHIYNVKVELGGFSRIIFGVKVETDKLIGGR